MFLLLVTILHQGFFVIERTGTAYWQTQKILL